MASSSDTALKTFSLTNDIKEISPQDQIYKYDAEANKRLIREQPWTSESAPVLDVATFSGSKLTTSHSPHYFKLCKISAVALIKMVHFWLPHRKWKRAC
jgi:COP9 signalosome complex subunit 5